ncbi:coiled-coil domain-containing protein 151 isoform X2 [Boleophthalmus pectinirostris]|uniref:coiled-coil domain-containing protein 151 isoform X2 n=1 Tax=Boleophthalmus pectinirostris TaxID=150288 RepID=UPI00242C3318|nr:coiled-coil domain-containing protein 151 isoform X2 [Boleophthalmus pectinirostris]
MPFSAETHKPPLSDQITELQRRIQLLEGDRTAFYETSQATIRKNREMVQQLREENTRLYKKLAAASEGDKHVVKVAFHNVDKISDKDAFRNMSGKVNVIFSLKAFHLILVTFLIYNLQTALATLDRKLQSKKKRLNAQKHITQTLQQRANELKLEYDRLKPLGSGASKTTDPRAQKREEDAMKLRSLENNLEKTQLKCKEAENITRNYLTLKSHLQDESLNFSSQLDSLEVEILNHKEELQNLQAMNHDAQLSAEASKAELQQREELLYKDRKERERYKAKVEEHKIQTEKVERRTQRTVLQSDDQSSEAQRSTTRTTGDEDKAMSTFEDVFRQIKEATGVTDIQEVAERFVTQKGIHEHLEKLTEENKNTLVELKEQKAQLDQQFEDKKYSGEAKISRDQHILEDCEQQLQAAQRRCDQAKETLSSLEKTLGTVQAGVEHLADKLQHIPLVEDTSTIVSTDSRLVELLSKCELKLQSLYSELQGKDFSAIMKMIEDEKFFLKIEGKLPTFNTRVLLPEDQRQELFDDGESDEDDAGTISREALKRQSQMTVDSKFKKKPWKKKK